jgi:hypothetical protein
MYYFFPGVHRHFEEESSTFVEGPHGPAYVRPDCPISLEDVSDHLFSLSVTEHMRDVFKYMNALGSSNASPIQNRLAKWIIFRTLR